MNILFNGGSLTVDSAIKLERIVGTPTGFWLPAVASYCTYLVRLTESDAQTVLPNFRFAGVGFPSIYLPPQELETSLSFMLT
ncbi:hypothetical protein CQ018_05070 [Arthrobacter sp. MYb227]|nr:hypothetical protein CQ018_05070 [Arthrobacter sp. MYb227]